MQSVHVWFTFLSYIPWLSYFFTFTSCSINSLNCLFALFSLCSLSPCGVPSSPFHLAFPCFLKLLAFLSTLVYLSDHHCLVVLFLPVHPLFHYVHVVHGFLEMLEVPALLLSPCSPWVSLFNISSITSFQSRCSCRQLICLNEFIK